MRTILIAFLAGVGFSFAAAAEFNLVPNRLAAARPGEWVMLENLSEAGEKAKITVVETTCADNEPAVVLRRENIDAGGVVTETTERTVKLSRYQERLDKLDQRAERISREKMLVKDRNITVYVIEWEDQEKDRDVKIWLSHDIPVGGFVRIWSSDPDFPTYEIVDFGTN